MKASPPWQLLWQTLTSQWFLFYAQCNRAEWAQPYAVSHWCASFQPTLFLGSRCGSALLGVSDGPIYKQPTVKEWPFIVPLNYWSAPERALPTITVNEGPLGKCLSKGGVVVIRWKVREERFWHSFGGPGDHPTLRQWVSWMVPGNRLGTTSFSDSEPSRSPSTSLGPGREERWTSPPSLSLQLNSRWPSFWVSGCENWSPQLDSLRRQDLLCWVPGSIKDESWVEYGNLALKELPIETCFCLTRMGHFMVQGVPWDFALSCQDRKWHSSDRDI